jgi:transcriptional antiterminator RfaH
METTQVGITFSSRLISGCSDGDLFTSTIGISRIVCHGDQPAPVRDGVVEELKRRQDERGLIRLERRARFDPGDPIRVVAGVFSEFLGLYEGMDERDRVAVLLNLLGRKVRVHLSSELVDAA